MTSTRTCVSRLVILVAGILGSSAALAAGPLRITVLYDNTTASPGCGADWGFACLVEGAPKTILFDTGTKAGVLAANVGALRVDLSRVDALVISHPHGDHTGGIPVMLKARPGLSVLLPFGSPSALVESLRSNGAAVAAVDGPTDLGPDVLVTGPVGGFHLLQHSDEAVAGIVARFRELGVARVGATHCTGEKAIAAFRKAYGPQFIEMGAGRLVELP